MPFNPLFLYGGVGLGKTHLMNAIAWHIRRRHPQRRVIYLSAEKFMYQFVRALRFKDTMAFKEQFRSVDVLMIDDVQFISGKDSTQEEFFHTFNALVDQNRQIVLSADKSPSDLEGIEERVRSRLGWGLVADIHPTTYELRLSILQSKAEQLGVAVPAKLLEFLAHKITSNIRELEGALNRINAHTTLVGRPVTLETAQEVLHDLLRANDRRVTIEEIQKRVAEHYSIRLADMHSPPGPGRGAAAAGRHVSRQAADLALAAGDRAQIRRARPHDGHACGAQDRGAAGDRSRVLRGYRAPAADARGLRPRAPGHGGAQETCPGHGVRAVRRAQPQPLGEIARRLDGATIAGTKVAGRILPVDLARVGDAIAQILDEIDPVAVVALGQADGEPVIRLERVALNLADFEIADNAGHKASEAPVLPDEAPACGRACRCRRSGRRCWGWAFPPACPTRPGPISATRPCTAFCAPSPNGCRAGSSICR